MVRTLVRNPRAPTRNDSRPGAALGQAALGQVVLYSVFALAMLLGCSCGSTRGATSAATDSPACEAPPLAAPEALTLDYWRTRWRTYGLDAPLMSADEVAAHNVAQAGRFEELTVAATRLSTAPLAAEVDLRLTHIRGQLSDLQDADGERVQIPSAMLGSRTLHFVRRASLQNQTLHCAPYLSPYFTTSLDPALDRNQCGRVHDQEVAWVSAWDDDLLLVVSANSLGWVAAAANFGPEITDDVAQAGLSAVQTDGVVRYLRPDSNTVSHFTAAGLEWRALPANAVQLPRPFTRGALLSRLFADVGRPYAWGGSAEGLDCSDYVKSVLGDFGIEVPRFSGDQAEAGTYHVSVPSGLSNSERQRFFDAALEDGLVLLHFPGHILVYLGSDAAGEPHAIHSFMDQPYLCDSQTGPREFVRRVAQVAVSNLRVGQGTERRSLIERVTHITVFGHLSRQRFSSSNLHERPGQVRVPEECEDSEAHRIFVSPHVPRRGEAFRIVATSSADPGNARLFVIGQDGSHMLPAQRLTGPPYSDVAALTPNSDMMDENRVVTVVWGDGNVVLACKRIRIAERGASPIDSEAHTTTQHPSGSPWPVAWRWEADTENFFSAFVQHLFSGDPAGGTVWRSLSELLADPQRNLLINHLGLDEDRRLRLTPDCADLPYLLRAYFAWKLRLPFSFRNCTRASRDRSAHCGPLWQPVTVDPVQGATSPSEIERFRTFATAVQNGVHSSNPQTTAGDAETDFYPIALNRTSLRPGVVFADPYGHVMVVVRLRPNSAEGPASLIAVDAQPDASIGLRTFWRGTFMMLDQPRSAGFRAFRPLVIRDGRVQALGDPEIAERQDFPQPSAVPSSLSAADFYHQVELAIEPQTLRWQTRAQQLVAALLETVVRRVASVAMAEEWFTAHPRAVIDMPPPENIFLASGPWEDYSTPSRDFRLLLAIDAILQLPTEVSTHLERFGLIDQQASEVQQSVSEAIQVLLAQATFSYSNSQGRSVTLTLADVVERQRGFEVSWNPNDCAELRWAAPTDSAEANTCRRRAPAAQQRAMAVARSWFERRERPWSN